MKLLILLLFPFICLGQTITLTDADVKAYPGAVGYGENVTGGAGGTVIHVTNLNDNGAGSLREAIDTHGARIIVFDVGGVINLSSSLRIGEKLSGFTLSDNTDEEDITILGQTAPSPGITLSGQGLQIYASNVIVRYLTVRPENTGTGLDGVEIRQLWSGYDLNGVILDHVTISHSDDENLSVRGNTSADRTLNVTISNCLISTGMETTGSNYGMLMGAYMDNLTFYETYFALHKDRSPFLGYGLDGETAEMINCIIHGFNEGSHIVYGMTADFIYNIWQDSNTRNAGGDWVKYYVNTFNNPGAVETDGDLYHVGDIFLNGPEQVDAAYNSANEASRRLTSNISTWETTQAAIESAVLDDAGNSLYRDALDGIMVDHYYDVDGDYTVLPTVPTIGTGSRSSYDDDADGLSNAYELAQGGTATSISATTRPATAEVSNGTVDQSGVTSYATLGYTHLDIFAADLAGDWDAIGFDADPVLYNQLKVKTIRIGSGKGGAYLGTTKIKG